MKVIGIEPKVRPLGDRDDMIDDLRRAGTAELSAMSAGRLDSQLLGTDIPPLFIVAAPPSRRPRVERVIEAAQRIKPRPYAGDGMKRLMDRRTSVSHTVPRKRVLFGTHIPYARFSWATP